MNEQERMLELNKFLNEQVRVTKQMQSLLDDAESAGYTINQGSTIKIYKSRGSRITNGIEIYQDGTAIRMGVDLTVTKAIRGYKEMRRALDLN